MTATKEAIATLHNYQIGLTTELDEDQTARLARFLDILAGESGDKYGGAVIWGKVGETPVSDFNPALKNLFDSQKED